MEERIAELEAKIAGLEAEKESLTRDLNVERFAMKELEEQMKKFIEANS